jgi:predicted ATPase
MSSVYEGSVYFASLGDATDSNGIVRAVLAALGIRSAGDRDPLSQVAGGLSGQPSLIVLDNLEQLIECGGSFVAELLTAVPSVTILATSRQPLGIKGEREFPVRPLPVPTMPGTPDRLIEFACVQMFVDRAQAVCHDFQITDRNAHALAAVCQKLEGLPLAIELAAAHANALTPAQMLTQLGDRFRFLVSRRKHGGTRHQALGAAFDWSFELLPEDLRRFIARLSVFRGGWTLEAAEHICEDRDALAAIEELIERSLIVPHEIQDSMRYQMLESLREYASVRLDAGERSRTLSRYTEFFLRMAEEAEPRLRGDKADEWIARLDADHGNFMEALDLTMGREAGLRLAGALWRFWYLRGYVRDGSEYLAAALAGTLDGSEIARSKACLGLGVLVQYQGDPERADELMKESLNLAEAAGDAFLTAEAYHNLALLAIQRGEREIARQMCEQALAQRYAIDDDWGAAASLSVLGSIEQILGNLPKAEEYYREGHRTYEEIGDEHQSALLLSNLGSLAYEKGDYAGARVSYELSLTLFRERKNRWAVAGTLHNLGEVAREQSDVGRADDLFRQSLSEFADIGDRATAAMPLAALGGLARRQGDFIKSARLLGASHALRQAQGLALSGAGQLEIDAELEAVKTALTPEDFATAWNYGTSLNWKRAVSLALYRELPRQIRADSPFAAALG